MTTSKAFKGETYNAIKAAGTAPASGPRKGIRLNIPAENPRRMAKSTLSIKRIIVQRVPTIKETSSWALTYLPNTLLILPKRMVECFLYFGGMILIKVLTIMSVSLSI